MHSEKFKLDFRTKMLMSLCLSYTLILGNIQTKFSIVAAAYSLLPYVFLLLNREKKAAVKGILFIMAAYIIQKEWVFSAGGFWGSLFLFITMMFLRLLPGFVMARFALAYGNDHGCDNRNLHVAADGSVCARGGVYANAEK